jgi:hypothetical protein
MSATHLRSPKHAFERQQPAGSLELQKALRQENEQLRTALPTRIVIEQAKGMLAERFEATERSCTCSPPPSRHARHGRGDLPAGRAEERTRSTRSAREASPTLAPRPQALRLPAEALRVTQSTYHPVRRPRTRHAAEGEQ